MTVSYSNPLHNKSRGTALDIAASGSWGGHHQRTGRPGLLLGPIGEALTFAPMGAVPPDGPILTSGDPGGNGRGRDT